MATVSETLKHALLNYPSIYPEKIDFLIYTLLSEGSNYEWNNGQLVNQYEPSKRSQKMDYSDINKRQDHLDPSSMGSLEGFYAHRRLELKVERMQRKIVEDNIDVICQNQWTKNLFREEYMLTPSQSEWIEQKKNYTNAVCFNFPDDIQADWGELIGDFFEWTTLRLNHFYGVSQKGNGQEHWPEKAKKLLERIEQARERMFPLLNEGKSLKQDREEKEAFTKKLFADLFSEQDEKKSSRPRMK